MSYGMGLELTAATTRVAVVVAVCVAVAHRDWVVGHMRVDTCLKVSQQVDDVRSTGICLSYTSPSPRD